MSTLPCSEGSGTPGSGGRGVVHGVRWARPSATPGVEHPQGGEQEVVEERDLGRPVHQGVRTAVLDSVHPVDREPPADVEP